MCFFGRKKVLAKQQEILEKIEIINNELQNNKNNLSKTLSLEVANSISPVVRPVIEKEVSEVKNKLESNNQLIEEKLKSLHSNMENLQKSNTDFMKELKNDVNENLKTMKETTENNLKEMKTVVEDKMAKAIQEKLENSFVSLNEHLRKVTQDMQEMQKLSNSVSDLNRTLSGVKQRGNFGEAQLDAILSNILSPDQYKQQFNLDGDSSRKVDFAVLMPTEDMSVLYLPIDSKYPLDSYKAIIEASDRGDKEELIRARKTFIKEIKTEAKDMQKKYIIKDVTVEYAVMYLPAESIYAEVVKEDGLLQELYDSFRIIVAGPSVISAMINTFSMGLKTIAFKKASSEVYELMILIKNEFKDYADAILSANKGLTKASSLLTNFQTKTNKINDNLLRLEAINTTIDYTKATIENKNPMPKPTESN